MIRIGSILRGFCGGHFGRDSYHDKRVEAIGADWIVVRALGEAYGPSTVEFATDPEILTKLEAYLV